LKVDGHFITSVIKSCFRIIGGGFLISGNFIAAGVLIIVAEVLGILEELV
jgi:hypothetical protein